MEKTNAFSGPAPSYPVKCAAAARGLGKSAIRSYSRAFQLPFAFLKNNKGALPENARYSALDEDALEQLPPWLEKSRGCSVPARSRRLHASPSFAVCAIEREPVEAAASCNAAAGIPAKKAGEAAPMHGGLEDFTLLGGKTGYTDEAGQCLASLAEKSGKQYILVTSGAQGDYRTQSLHVEDALAVYASISQIN
jgi:hypothetical protein